MIDKKINFQFDSIFDAGLNQFNKEEIKQIESCREQIIEIRQERLNEEGTNTVKSLEQKIKQMLRKKSAGGHNTSTSHQ